METKFMSCVFYLLHALRHFKLLTSKKIALFHFLYHSSVCTFGDLGHGLHNPNNAT